MSLHEPEGSDWIALTSDPLPVERVSSWLILPSCGATVTFTGTARDHAADRADVRRLAYEAYEDQALRRMAELVDEARTRWPELVRLALIHRTGVVELGEAAVVVGTSSAHRGPSFEAARWAIDALKATVPIWKHETWDGGASWGVDAQHLVDLGDLPRGDRE